VIGEHNLEGKVIGLAMDGTGYGTDNTIWGCEFLLADRKDFKRLAHLESIGMPGGDMASLQPWRMAISYLIHTFGATRGSQYARALPFGVQREDVDVVIDMVVKNVNCPPTSGMGRLFDAVSSITGICHQNEYEAQAAIEMEYFADKNTEDAYEFTTNIRDNAVLTISAKYVIAAIIADMEKNTDTTIISAKFHNAMVNIMEHTARKLAEIHSCRTIALAGGVFQNRFILEKLTASLRGKGFDVYYNQKLPVNDGSISFGQAIIADALCAENLNR